MDKCVNSYKQCMKHAIVNDRKVRQYVCHDKILTCLGETAKVHGNNNLWPFHNSYNIGKDYIAVKDMDRSFKNPPQNNPFAIPPRQITGGFMGDKNRKFPYQYLHGNVYGGTMN